MGNAQMAPADAGMTGLLVEDVPPGDVRAWPLRKTSACGGVSRARSQPSNAPGQFDARFGQVAQGFPHQQNVGLLQRVVIAELELIGLGHDEAAVGFAEDA
jgi:hypothetical protein